MDQWKNADEILDFAIKNEEEAAALYTGLAAKSEKPWMKTVFEGFAKEAEGHKAKLVAVKKGQKLQHAEKQIMDLKIGDYLIDVEPSPNLDYQDALIIAMKAEKAAFKLYSDIAKQATDPDIRSLFQLLAQEEAKHKLRFEVEYDEFVLKNN